jgi:hypothetical protein
MQKRFDLHKLTLTDFKPSEFQQATSKLKAEQKKEEPAPQPSTDPVPEGRTTLKLNKVRGVVSSQSKTPEPPPAQEMEKPVFAQDENAEQAPYFESVIVGNNADAPKGDQDVLPKDLVAESPPAPISTHVISENVAEPETPLSRDERSAALHAHAIKSQYKKQSQADKDDLVAFNSRQPKWLKELFFKVCHEKGATPSLVMRNLMKSYCGLCLILALFSISFARGSGDSSYTTEQILSYFYSKTFGLKSLVPDLKSSVALRHSLWQTGSYDSTDYIYADRSTTRLEARVEMPILDVSYLKDRSKDKDELRAFVMKSLSKILAAQKSVNVLESRLSAINRRLEYLRTQATLKLVNKSDIFPVEDEFYNVQTQLNEAQSTLEQRIIDLAVIAGNDWLDAYNIIVKWDGKLF